MAFPTIVSTAETAISTASTSHPVTLPASIVSTDLVLLTCDIGSTSATVNSLTGWSEDLDESAANGLKIIRYTGAGVPSNPTFTLSGATRGAWIAWRISGASKSVAVQIATTGTGTSATPDPPSVTPTGGIVRDYLFIAIVGMAGEEADDDTWANTPPTNYVPTPPVQVACGVAGTNLGGLQCAASRQLNTGSAQDPNTFGVDVSAAWRTQHIIVHPISQGASTGTVAWVGSSTGARASSGSATGSVTWTSATGTNVVTDDFNRANGGLGSNWTTFILYTAPGIISNAVRMVINGTFGAYWSAASFNSSQYVQVSAAALTSSSRTTALLVRTSTDPATDKYQAHWSTDAGGTYAITKTVGTTPTTLASTTGVGLTNTRLLRLAVAGDTLIFYVDGIEVLRATDASFSSGLLGFASVKTGIGDTAIIDDFEAGNLTSTATGTTVRSGASTGTVAWVGVASGAKPVTGAATGAVSWVGSATGTSVHRGSSAGTVAWVGSATGMRTSLGSATGAISWAGASTGTTIRSGAATGAVSWVGSSTGASVHNGASTGSVAWAGSATGVTTKQGSATGAIAWVGASSGTRASIGSSTGSIAWAGSASGAHASAGSSTGSITWAGLSAGARISLGSSTGSITWVGSATGQAPPDGNSGDADGSITWAGSATGTTTHSGSSSGSVTWAGSSVGVSAHSGSAVGSVTWSGTSSGATTHVGASTGSITWTGAATGQSPSAGVKEGAGIGFVTWVGIATGIGVYTGQTTGTITWAGVATGTSLVDHPGTVELVVNVPTCEIEVTAPTVVIAITLPEIEFVVETASADVVVSSATISIETSEV